MRLLMTIGIAATVWAPFALLGEEPTAGRTLHVSLVEKNAVSHYFSRLATEFGQVVATNDPVANAKETIEVFESAEERIFLVETLTGDRPLRGEVARFEQIAVVKVPNSFWVLHEFLGDHTRYGEAISHTLTTIPENAKNNGFSSVDTSKRRFQFEINEHYLTDKLSQFSGATETVIDGATVRIEERRSPDGRANARAWLAQEFSALGFQVGEHDYGRGKNFVAERQGSDPSQVLIVSAHIDSVGNAGADDNGGGVIAALAVAQALQDLELAISLRFLGFDEEERGLVGSAAYARSLNDTDHLENIVGVVNIEMPGYDADKDGALHIIDCNENSSANLTAVFEQVLDRESLGLHKVAACTNRSDHASFWRFNKPAIVISQNFFGGDSNPCYHRSCDRLDRVDFGYMRKITEMLAFGISDLVVE